MRNPIKLVTSISPAWWGAIAGVAAASATIFTARRVTAAAIGGGAMLALALYRSAAACGCTAGASAPDERPAIAEPEPAPPPPPKEETWEKDYGMHGWTGGIDR